MQKSVVFLYMSNERSEKEITKTIPLIIAPKTIKYLGINLTKEVKDLYNENYKIFPKESRKDINKWKRIPCSWIGRLNIVNMSVLPKVTY